MSVLRRLLLAQALIVALILAATFLLPDAAGLAIITLILLAEPIADGIALVYLIRLYQSDQNRPRSWLLAFLTITSAEVFLGLVPIALLTLRRLAGFSPLPTPLNTATIAFALSFIGAAPVLKAVMFRLISTSTAGDPRNHL